MLLYFDRTLGPRVFLTSPSDLAENLEKQNVNKIKSLLDSGEEGFFSHYFSQELKTANWIFKIKSDWARGRREMLMITIIAPEEEPDFSYYEELLSKFIGKIKGTSGIFKGLYIDSQIEGEMNQIQKSYQILKEEVNNLYKIVSVKVIETEGDLISLETLKKRRKIDLSSQVINRISKISNSAENCFIVFRTRGESTKIDIIPVKTEKVIRLAIIFGEQMTVRIVQQIGQIFTRYEDSVSLIFTSGICQEIDRCIYEVYIDPNMEKLNNIIEEIYKIEGVLSIEVKLIDIDN
ncbi:MAG: hypothetical protein ACQERB_11775 [Promethearchaeati archaeon]